MLKIRPSDAKERLDLLLRKGVTDLYKPIQIAEVLRQLRTTQTVNAWDLESYKNKSLKWRDEVTLKLSNKKSTSSARYQHDIWNDTAMPPPVLSVLSDENKQTNGAVERYIYLRYAERQGAVTTLIAAIEIANVDTFDLAALLQLFETGSGMKRSIDKAYEIIAHSLFETIITGLGAKVHVSVDPTSEGMLEEFGELARVLLGVEVGRLNWEQPAHIYRSGVTNAADRGMDMWANFGPTVQVKHLTLKRKEVNAIVDQVEGDHIVIVCRDADSEAIDLIMKQIGWGRRVRGIVRETDLINWYDRCLRGKFAPNLGQPLLKRLLTEFKSEFPQTARLADFLEERGYSGLNPPDLWQLPTGELLKQSNQQIDN